MARPDGATGWEVPDLTALVDVVFQLLLLIIVVSHFEVIEADERLKLPRQSLAKLPEARSQQDLVLEVRAAASASRDPVVWHAGQSVPVTELATHLEGERRRITQQSGDSTVDDVSVIVRADEDVPTGVVQNVIKTCQDAGFSKFSLKAGQDE